MSGLLIKMYIITVLICSVSLVFGCTNMRNSQNLSEAEVSLLKFAERVSESDSSVLSVLEMFLIDKNRYFKKFEDDLYQRGIEDPADISKEIVLIDALEYSGKLAYVDHATEADWVMEEIDRLSNGNISKNSCFKTLVEAYKRAGKYNAIGNFVADATIAPMPFDCISSQGYKLLAIDEGSDSYAFILLKNTIVAETIKYANDANIKLFFSNKT